MPRRVLMVAYNFPPVGGVGIQRTLKFATYLPRSGWEPIVLTARNPRSEIRESDAEDSPIAGLAVERAFSPEPVKLRRALGALVRPLRGRRGGQGGGPAGASASGVADRRWTRRLLAVWGAWTRLTFFPDEVVGWVPFAARRGCALDRDRPFDAVYSSSPPVSGHLAAALVACRTKRPWVADFRDPWIGNAFARPPRLLHGAFQRRIERRIAERADRIVFAAAGIAEDFGARYPHARSRCVVIPNGYDLSDLAGVAETSAAGSPAGDGRFHIVYGGSLYGTAELRVFLDGLEHLVERRPEVRDRLAVDFVGLVNLECQALAAGYAAPNRLGSIVRFVGFVPHAEALARLRGADALLLIIAPGPGKDRIVSGKLMEYIGLDRQILAVVPEGDASRLLAELDWGIVADPTPEGVAQGVERVLATPVPRRRADPERRYDRVKLTVRLAAVLDAIVGGAAETR
jgi:glycosyltransferase involved in cell wall biosynthesis